MLELKLNLLWKKKLGVIMWVAVCPPLKGPRSSVVMALANASLSQTRLVLVGWIFYSKVEAVFIENWFQLLTQHLDPVIAAR